LAVKIRLRRMGAKKHPFYRIVVADSRSPRRGRFIESIGYFNPCTEPPTVKLDEDKARDWLSKGAQPSDTARDILFKLLGEIVPVKKGRKKRVVLEAAPEPAAEIVETKAEEAVVEAEAAPVEEAVAEEEKPKKRARRSTKKAVEAEETKEITEQPEAVVEETPAVEQLAVEVEEAPAVEQPQAEAEEAPVAEAEPNVSAEGEDKEE